MMPIKTKKRKPHIKTSHFKDRELYITSNQASPFKDAYYFFLKSSWAWFMGMFGLVFVSMNVVFGLLYWGVGGVSGDTLTLLHSFFFSVQTLSTVGYGQMHPVTLGAHLIVMLESMVGVLLVAITTGLVFAKFSRPISRILFSHKAVMNTKNGVPFFSFRVANERSNHIAEAQIRVTVLKSEETLEGEKLRRIYDLKLERDTTPLFILSWLVMHRIEKDSPLYDISAETFKADNMMIMVSLTGYDTTLGQTAHARFAYRGEDLVWGARFVDAIETNDKGQVQLHFDRFHQVVSTESVQEGH